MKRRVVITGMGIVSCIGNGVDAVTESLRSMRSGIAANARYRELGLRSQVSGSITDREELLQ
jgi:3-oxoacyl-[acyl-carrier-protein] synthase I